VLVTFLLLFILMEGPMLGRRIGQLIGPGAIQAKASELLAEMSNQCADVFSLADDRQLRAGDRAGVFYRLMGLSEPWAKRCWSSSWVTSPYLGLIAAGIPPVLDAFVSRPASV
jgi:hypothetical protein